jgi:hypothetical protein
LPASLHGRLLMAPERRGRGRPKESLLYNSMMASEMGLPMNMGALAGAGMLPGGYKFPLNIPFGALPNLGMTNPMLGLAGFPGLAGLSMPEMMEAAEAMQGKDSKSSPNKKEGRHKHHSKPSTSSVNIPHPSFPLLYNPLMYNPLLAAQGLRNFTLPTSVSSSFASLAQSAAMVNGMAGMVAPPGSDSEDEAKAQRKLYEKERERQLERQQERQQDRAEDLSVHKPSSASPRKHHDRHKHRHREHRDGSHSSHSPNKPLAVQEAPTDLSMKPKQHKDQQYTRTKPKILSSNKLSRIVDSLKDKVMKMEGCDRVVKRSKPSESDSGRPRTDGSERHCERSESRSRTESTGDVDGHTDKTSTDGDTAHGDDIDSHHDLKERHRQSESRTKTESESTDKSESESRKVCTEDEEVVENHGGNMDDSDTGSHDTHTDPPRPSSRTHEEHTGELTDEEGAGEGAGVGEVHSEAEEAEEEEEQDAATDLTTS